MEEACVLLVGEVCIDFTVGSHSHPVKMRLGGIVHAARGLWACGIPYSIAAVCPEYLAAEAEAYVAAHGCRQFIRLGNVKGAPNVFIIGDVREVGHQGYENLLRATKSVTLYDVNDQLRPYSDVVIFPGAYDLASIAPHIAEDARVTVDVAYDLASLDELDHLSARNLSIAISTSSDLFMALAHADLSKLIESCRKLGARFLLVKENRGGSRLFFLDSDEVEHIPAVLSETTNSVGVGDVYTAVFSGYPGADRRAAAWRGMQVATRYAGTTYPDDFARDVRRELRLEVDEVRALGGTILPWHDRPRFQIYLAAPDFSYVHKPEIDEAVRALEYHNFRVRRPVIENGEAERGSQTAALRRFYEEDVSLLYECDIVFGVPLGRDPGTLIEIGMAIAKGIPVVTFDPRNENDNTMVICGSEAWSNDLDVCLNAVFNVLSAARSVQ
jgi:nucleoside 2-deoxyribosyltransferase/sugar/nucleoside kinase (ribokinase family)